MSRQVRVGTEAEAEFRAAIEWYEEQRPGLGQEFHAAISDALAELEEVPDSSTPVPLVPERVPARRSFVKRFPYQIVYLLHDSEVRVIAVAHLHRKPGYWRTRR